MDRIREQITRPVLIGAAAGLVLGLLLGLLFGWQIWPVQWTDAGIQHLREDLQRDYLLLSVQNFAQTANGVDAQRRWDEMQALGEQRERLLAELQAAPPAPLTPDQVNSFANAVQASGLPSAGTTTQPGGVVGEQPGEATGSAPGGLTLAMVMLCLLALVIGGLLIYLFFFRNRRPALANAAGRSSMASPMAAGRTTHAQGAVAYPEGQEPPIVQYLTTYNLGNDLYDDSFSIDSPSGEFLGECGVGISETIGVGDPKKVTAFEVWLFDKNDIQTVTKVLMSQHAFHDAGISQRLQSKGEPVLVEPGKHIVLETATLQLEARVVNMNYGQGALPANSFFEQMTLELQVWPKP